MPELSTLGATIKAAYILQNKAFTDPLWDKLNALAEGVMLPNQLLYGSATWLTGLTFEVSAWAAIVNGTVYTGAAEQVTLSAANGSNPRIDIIAVNVDGTADVVTGTAAADPAKPEIDPDTQVEMTFVLVATSATTPSGVANTSVYEENIEWTSAVSGGTVDATNTTSPYAGTKDIRFNAAANGAYVTLTGPSSYSPTAFERLCFRIKNISYGTATNVRMRVALYNTATRVSNWIDLRDTNYGFSGTNVASYQFIQIPVIDFGLNGANYNRLRFEVAANGANTISFYLDNIFFQTGTPVTNTANFALLDKHNVFSKAQGSAIVTLTDAATIAWDMDVGNVFQVTLAGNRTFAAPTNVKPGYMYYLIMSQDGTGNRVPTFNAVFKWRKDQTPVFSQAASAVDVIEMLADASGNLHCMIRETPRNTMYVGQNDQTDNYTLVAADEGKVINMNHATGKTLTIPANSSVPFPVNTRIDVYQEGAGQTTVAITTDTLRGDPKIPAQYKMVSLYKRSSTVWVIAGGST